ncbi:MAG: DNA polymerase beta superfamily protein [Solirubrobacterales bacterium]
MLPVEQWLEERIILKVYRGSLAYGTAVVGSDVDIQGIAIPPPNYLYGLSAFEQWESKTYTAFPGFSATGEAADTVIFGLHKFIKLAAAGNPNILEILFTGPKGILFCGQLGRKLLAARELFLTRRVKDTFAGYALTQLRRLQNKNPMDETRRKAERLQERQVELELKMVRLEHEQMNLLRQERLAESDAAAIVALRRQIADLNRQQTALELDLTAVYQELGRGGHQHHGAHRDLIKRFGYDTKHAMHLIRLLRMGNEILSGQGVVVLRPDADELLAIRNGERPLASVQEEATALFKSMEHAAERTTLPAAPDMDRIERLVMDLVEASMDPGLWKVQL